MNARLTENQLELERLTQAGFSYFMNVVYRVIPLYDILISYEIDSSLLILVLLRWQIALLNLEGNIISFYDSRLFSSKV